MIGRGGDAMYVEPFAGMLGVLCSRRPSRFEIVNDISGDVYNWWTVVRDQPDELCRLLAATPRRGSEAHWRDAQHLCRTGESSVRRAYWFHLAAQNSVAGEYTGRSSFRRGSPGTDRMLSCEEVSDLADRLADVRIWSLDAVAAIRRLENFDAHRAEDMLVYVDPPYRHVGNLYSGHAVDFAALAEALLESSCRVAVSGYPDDWPELDGWDRYSFATRSTASVGLSVDRVECLWLNFDPAHDPRLF